MSARLEPILNSAGGLKSATDVGELLTLMGEESSLRGRYLLLSVLQNTEPSPMLKQVRPPDPLLTPS
eukprot:7413947-Pyramimonas_sp.AAC.1